MFEKEYEDLKNAKIVPVVAVDSVEDAIFLAKALQEGGMKSIEITFRNPNDYEGTALIISEVKKNVKGLLVGAGTVTNCMLAKMAIEAGSSFVVSPGFSKEVISYCIEKNVVPYPGVASATEIMDALTFGISVLKLFPAEILGGINLLKAFSGPFPNVKFLPSGGINEKNAKSFYEQKNVIALSGSWMVSKELIMTKDWKKVTSLSKSALELCSS